MILQQFISHFESKLGVNISSHHRVSGGDINQAYCLKCTGKLYFVKLNYFKHGDRMLETEAKGLLAIEESGAMPVPKALVQGFTKQFSYLILEWITAGVSSHKTWINFARNLASLHKTTYPSFGFFENNFIGSLNQANKWHDRWEDFFAEERLIPQIKLAYDAGFFKANDLNLAESLCVKISQHCPEEAPSLIHGDLWGGNYIINQKGNAFLIDPSVSYGHREMDIAMSKLFDGFPPSFYDSYQEAFPLETDFENRIELYQLYYLLVHLNLFGASYLNSCRQILSKFS